MSPRAEILPLTRPRVHKFFLDQFDILGVPWEIANIVRKSDHRGLRLKCGRHGRTLGDVPHPCRSSPNPSATVNVSRARPPGSSLWKGKHPGLSKFSYFTFFAPW